MADHYYTKHPESKMKTEASETTLKGHVLTFTMSSGVFSKKGIDFGTKLLIENFRAPSIEGTMLDMGCGYGPIGITLAKEYPRRNVKMVDINERALGLAARNAANNGVENVDIVGSTGFSALEGETFAAVVTNPPIRAGKKIVYQMMEDAFSQLTEHGELWVVIQKKQGAPSLIKFLENLFQEVQEIDRKKGYFIIRAVKNSKA